MSTQPRHKSRARACTACRQVKLKCDAREKAPDPCTRCQIQGLGCKMDPLFKRVPARRQLEEVSKSVKLLRNALGLDETCQPSASLGDHIRKSHRPDLQGIPFPSSTYQFPVRDEPSSPDDQTLQTTPRPFYDIEDETETGTWKLGGISFEAADIRILFKHFDETHYKHGPFLEPCKSLHSYFRNSELLFWTITMIGCFVFNEYDEYYWKLLPHHRALLSSNMMGAKAKLSTVHAMLCMATWTYPVSVEYDDLTWMLCGAAIHTAMIMGLHKPGHMHEYSLTQDRDPGLQYTRNVTWLSIFIISTGISSWLGMPPPLGAASHLETISMICRDASIPLWYRARAEIHYQTVQLVNSINSGSDFNARHMMIRLYESALDRVKNDYEETWNDDLEIEWEGARLYLYGIAFVQPTPTPMMNTPETTIAAREILLKGLAAAVGCLDTVLRMRLPPTHPGENRCKVDDNVYQLGFYPKHFFRIGAFASYYLLWFLNVDMEASPQDKEVAKTYITATCKLLTSFTHSFEHRRAGQAMELLASMPIDMASAGTSVQTRLGAGIMYSVAMGAEATLPGSTASYDMGIDSVGSDGPAHPKVVEYDITSSQKSTNSEHSSAPASEHSPYPVQNIPGSTQQEPQYAPMMPPFNATTPTSVHSAPEPQRSVPQFQQPVSAGQEMASLMENMSPEHIMVVLEQMGQMAPGHGHGHGQTSAADQHFMTNAAFDPAALAAAMPNVSWEYPYGGWDASVLQGSAPEDPTGASQWMRDTRI